MITRMALTKAQAQAQLDAAITALEAARNGSWSVGEFSVTPPSVTDAQRDVDYWQNKVNELSVTASGSRWTAVGRWTG